MMHEFCMPATSNEAAVPSTASDHPGRAVCASCLDPMALGALEAQQDTANAGTTCDRNLKIIRFRNSASAWPSDCQPAARQVLQVLQCRCQLV